MAKSSKVKSKGSSKKTAKPAAKAAAKKKPAAKAAAKKKPAAKAKAAAKKPAANAKPARKKAPMKAAPKMAPMKAAPKKAPMKAAKASPAKAAGNAGATTGSAVDDGWSDVETSAPRQAQTSLPLSPVVSSDHHSKVAQHVLRLYQSTIDPDAELATVLSVDPNDFDLDPSPFYEALEQTFKVEDPSKHEFAGYGGTLKETIEFIAARWKGGEITTSDAYE